MPRGKTREPENPLSYVAWMKLAVVWATESRGTALTTPTDIATAELGEFVTEHAFFVNRPTRRNGTRARLAHGADLKFAKNGRNK
jgi:hypothetical protein